jgi:predicted CXXCH cytochrome family protein
MRKLLIAAVSVTALVMLASKSPAGVVGSAHDLRTFVGGSSNDEVCVFCHTPHNALSQLVPLWNHATSTVSNYTLYSSSTLDATLGQPAGVSKACLSCHDGTVAVDSYAGATGTHTLQSGNPALLGTDLSNDHPISLTYNSALATADKGLVTPVSASFVDGASEVPLYSGQLECGSCHNPHDNTYTPFLRKSNAASALCTTCHIK